MVAAANSVFDHKCTLSVLALLPCRAHFVADAVCDFRSMSWLRSAVLRRAFTDAFMCHTLVFAEPTSSTIRHLRIYVGKRNIRALPCFANCANLQIERPHDLFSDANAALEWLLGTHGVARRVRHLSIRETDYWAAFLRDFIVAVEQVRVASCMLGLSATCPLSH